MPSRQQHHFRMLRFYVNCPPPALESPTEMSGWLGFSSILMSAPGDSGVYDLSPTENWLPTGGVLAALGQELALARFPLPSAERLGADIPQA